MKIIAATNNNHKLEEFRAGFNAQIYAPKDIGILDFNPEENGDSFEANAMIKAKSLYQSIENLNKFREYLIIADDSGLCVSALDDKPGPLSARWSNVVNNISDKENSDDHSNRIALANSLKKLNLCASRAYFKCCVAFALKSASKIKAELIETKAQDKYQILESKISDNASVVFGITSGITHGIVAINETGDHGFGYDSMFYIDKDISELNLKDQTSVNKLRKSIATLNLEEKIKISHRGKAINALSCLINRLRN